MISVRIRAYGLEVEIQSAESHPDHLTDLCNRASTAFIMGVTTLKNNGIDLYAAHGDDLDDDD